MRKVFRGSLGFVGLGIDGSNLEVIKQQHRRTANNLATERVLAHVSLPAQHSLQLSSTSPPKYVQLRRNIAAVDRTSAYQPQPQLPVPSKADCV